MARKRSSKGPASSRQNGAPGSTPGGASDRPASAADKSRPGLGVNNGRAPVLAAGASGKGLGQRRPVPSAGSARSKAVQSRQRVIPDAVANRMARRIAIATGIPTVMGMGVFIGSYVVVSRGILDLPPGVTLLASGACFLLGLVGLSYGVLSSSWEDAPGSLLGQEQIGVNISRVRDSIRAMRQGSSAGPEA